MKKKGFLSYYNTYLGKIYRYIFFRVDRNKALAEDLTSEIFLKAYEKFEGFDHERSFGVWIYRIAHNHLADHYKKLKPVIVPIEDAEHAIKSASSPEKELATSMNMEKVGSALSVLPENQKNVFVMKFFNELSNTEIAQILNITEEHIRVLQHRALQTLRLRLGYLNP